MENLRAWGARELVPADSWGDFMKFAISERPDWCLLSLECLIASGKEALTSTEWTLRALKLGAVISVSPAFATVQYEVEASTEFELFVPEPIDLAVLAPLVAQLTGMTLTPPGDSEDAKPALTATHATSELSWTEELAADLDFELGDDSPLEFMDFPLTGSSPVVQPSAASSESFVAGAASEAGIEPDESANVVEMATGSTGRDVSASAMSDMSVTRRMSALNASLLNDASRPYRQQIYRESERLPAPLLDLRPSRNVEGVRQSIAAEAGLAPAEPAEQSSEGASVSPGHVELAENFGLVEDASDGSVTVSTAPFGFRAPSASGAEAQPVPVETAAQELDSPSEAERSYVGVPLDVPRTHLVTLTGVRGGVLHGVRIPKILFGLYVTQATGRLRIVQDNLQRDFLLYQGFFGRVVSDPTLCDESRLLGTFSWETGTYIFEEEAFDASAFQSFGHPLDILYRGIATRLSVDTVMKPLTPYLRSFPVCTTGARWLEQVPSLERVSSTLNALCGVLPLERAIVSVGDAADDVLRRAYFGWLTGALLFEASPNPERVPVQFTTDFMTEDPDQLANVRRMADTMARKRRTHQSLTSATVVSPGAPGQRPLEAVTIDPAVEQAARELNGLLRGFANRPPHAALGLEPGCGLTALSSRYYELVRLYHPDRYAKGYSDDVRALAQRVFLEIRVAHERAQLEEEADIRTAGQAVSTPGSGTSSPGFGPTGAHQAVAAGSPSPGSTDGPSAGMGQTRKVSDVLERVRARHASTMTGTFQTPVITPPSAPSVSKAPTASLSNNEFGSAPQSVRKIATLNSRPTVSTPAVMSPYAGVAPEQLFRNAKRALVAGANSKALELLDAAKERGISGPSFDAHELYLRYSLQELSAVRVLPLLEELTKSVDQPAELSQVLVLLGHVLRMEERMEKALDYYSKALDADKLNEEAIRWARHLRSRTEKSAGSGQGFLNKILNGKITLSPTKK
jgi:tetratricopeptide (TPR) repeat protein